MKPWLRLKKWRIVMIISGKDKGETGKVRRVLRESNSVIVADRNLVFKHVSPSESVPTGRLRKEMPIHVSNVSLVHPDTKMAVKIETRRLVDAKTGKLEARRFVRGTDIEVPKVKHMEYQNDWMEGELDTLAEEVAKVTFIPSLDTPPLPASVVNELRNKYSKHRPEKEKKRAAIALAQ